MHKITMKNYTPTLTWTIEISVDLAFPGIEAAGVEVIMPHKKPKGKELTNHLKEFIELIGSIRVKVDHAVAGVKKLKIINNQIGLHGWQNRDRTTNIAYG